MMISGWGQYPKIDANLFYPENKSQCFDYIKKKSLIPRGSGKSYGDSANADNVLQSLKINKVLKFDKINGVITCEAGVTFRDLISIIVPEGWFFPVTPGTSFLTVGGAIAADVHGKNHHIEGSFSDYILNIDMILGSGDFVLVSKEIFPDLFYATCGGMGLTGFIFSATLKLKRITSSKIIQGTRASTSLEEVCENFEKFSSENYSVAWIDTIATGKDFGKSILFYGNHANDKDFIIEKFKPLNLPMKLGSLIINKYTMNIFNKIYYKKNHTNNESKRLIDINNFFYPLDKIKNWNLVYGSKGFIQYQFVIPKKNSISNLKKILKTINYHDEFSSLAVLKLLGKNNNNYLSFPMEGLTLALDFKLSNSIIKLTKFLDEMIVDMSGKIYLAKDALMKEDVFKKTYTKWREFENVRHKYLAVGKFSSTQSRRLGLL
jgi:decaprenylphospho-beta-D-ribofuranose 2-oxidase